MERYVLNEIGIGGHVISWEVEDVDGVIRKVGCISPQYNGRDGKVVSYYNPGVVSNETIINGDILRKAQSRLTDKGDRATKAKKVQDYFKEIKQAGDKTT